MKSTSLKHEASKERIPLWIRLGDLYADYKDNAERPVDRKRYLLLLLLLGSLTGAHRFYAGHPIQGTLYLLFFWTGIPFGMSLVDLMIALPKEADEQGRIYV